MSPDRGRGGRVGRRDVRTRDAPEYGPPIRVADGLRARTARGAIGASWWSRRFLDVLESFALGSRLARGRSYARAGQVVELTIGPGLVHARVQGSRRTPYEVDIELAVVSDRDWATVESALAGQALFGAQLLAGEMPAEIERVFDEADAPLFPQAIGDLGLSCSCPDWEVPCKHLAATFYLLAESFDDDPFQILRWRGRDRETLLAELRRLRVVDDPPGTGDPHVARPARDAPVSGRPQAADTDAAGPAVPIDRFWFAPVPLPDQPATVAAESGLLLRQLAPPSATLGGEELLAELRVWYSRLGEPRDHAVDHDVDGH